MPIRRVESDHVALKSFKLGYRMTLNEFGSLGVILFYFFYSWTLATQLPNKHINRHILLLKLSFSVSHFFTYYSMLGWATGWLAPDILLLFFPIDPLFPDFSSNLSSLPGSPTSPFSTQPFILPIRCSNEVACLSQLPG